MFFGLREHRMAPCDTYVLFNQFPFFLVAHHREEVNIRKNQVMPNDDYKGA